MTIAWRLCARISHKQREPAIIRIAIIKLFCGIDRIIFAWKKERILNTIMAHLFNNTSASKRMCTYIFLHSWYGVDNTNVTTQNVLIRLVIGLAIVRNKLWKACRIIAKVCLPFRINPSCAYSEQFISHAVLHMSYVHFTYICGNIKYYV